MNDVRDLLQQQVAAQQKANELARLKVEAELLAKAKVERIADEVSGLIDLFTMFGFDLDFIKTELARISSAVDTLTTMIAKGQALDDQELRDLRNKLGTGPLSVNVQSGGVSVSGKEITAGDVAGRDTRKEKRS